MICSLNLGKGLETSLVDKCEAARRSVEDDKFHTAINILEDFIKKVLNQRGKKIPEAAADKLIASIQLIIDGLEDL